MHIKKYGMVFFFAGVCISLQGMDNERRVIQLEKEALDTIEEELKGCSTWQQAVGLYKKKWKVYINLSKMRMIVS